MEKKMTRQPVKTVMVRRGAVSIPEVPTQKLKAFIRKKALLGTDEISGDGKSWIRIDRHYQLRKFFLKEGRENAAESSSQPLPDDLEFSGSPPDFENNLREAADLLKDLNG